MAPVTIKTIAQQLGITHGTVSRALRSDPKVKPATTARVQAAAVALGYTPSRLGRGLKTQQTKALGMLIAEISNPFLSEVVQGVHDAITPAGYSLILTTTAHLPDREAQGLQHFREQRVDGLLLCLPRLHAPTHALLSAADIPTVVLNAYGETAHPATVAHDDERAAREIIAYLAGLGHRRIGYLGNAQGGGTQQARLAGYHAGLKHAALPSMPQYQFVAPRADLTAGAAAARQWLALPPLERPTALFCYNDVLAMGVLHSCRHAGVRVPNDLAIIGFDDIEFAAYTEPALTSFAQPKYALGLEAAKLLLGVIQHAAVAAPLTLYGQLVQRGSTSPWAGD